MRGIDKLIYSQDIRNTRYAIKAISKGKTIYIDYIREMLEKEFIPIDLYSIKKVKLHYENKIISAQETNNLISYCSCSLALIAVMISLTPLGTLISLNTSIVTISLLIILLLLISFTFATRTHLRSCNTIVSVLNDIIHKKENDLILIKELERADKELERLKINSAQRKFALELEKRRNKRWKPLDL